MATLVLEDATGLQHLEMVLNAGRRYRAVAPRPELKAQLLRRLHAAAPVAVVAPRGGLIGNLKVWENLVLPVLYRSAQSQTPGGETSLAVLEARAAALFRELGVARERFAELCGLLPEKLSEFERRLAAFVRGVLAEPEIMVYDSLFDGLTRPEADKAARFDRVFERHYPFRTAMYVDAEDPMLPAHAAYPTFHL